MGQDDIKKKAITQNRTQRKERKRVRKTNTLKIIPKILILTEGLSEIHYFEALILYLSLSTVTLQKSKYSNLSSILGEADQIVQATQKLIDQYDFIFCVADLDTAKNFSNIMFEKKVGGTKIIPVVCYPCIEVWFILHYFCIRKPFVKKGKLSIGESVKKYYKEHCDNEYTETNVQSIQQIISNFEQALINANQLFNQQHAALAYNPITSIHNLVSLLNNISNRTNQYDFEQNVNTYIQSCKV